MCGSRDIEQRLQSLTEEFSGRRFVLYYWVADALPLLGALCKSGVGIGVDFAVVSSVNWLGAVVAGVLRGRGRRVILVSSGRSGVLVRDVQRVLREPAPICVTADGRGPFGVVSPGLVRLVEARQAIAIPLGVCCSRAIRVARPIPCTIPIPGSRVEVAMGDPIIVEGASAVSAGALETALLAARELARHNLSARDC